MRKIPFVAAVLFLTTARISAHHAFAAEYDENKHVTVSGTVTGFKWTNPHAWLYVEGTDSSGKTNKWSFEMGSPGGLVHRGWKKLELTIFMMSVYHRSPPLNGIREKAPEARVEFDPGDRPGVGCSACQIVSGCDRVCCPA